jgi:hypothetical protein
MGSDTTTLPWEANVESPTSATVSPPPLTPVSVAVQFMQQSMLSAEEREQFEDFFPRFFEEPPAELPGAGDWKGVEREPTYVLRRFSGGANLERSRYCALLDHGIETNASTLAAELLAYSHSDSSDWTSIFDLRRYPPTTFQNVMSQAQLERVAQGRSEC